MVEALEPETVTLLEFQNHTNNKKIRPFLFFSILVLSVSLTGGSVEGWRGSFRGHVTHLRALWRRPKSLQIKGVEMRRGTFSENPTLLPLPPEHMWVLLRGPIWIQRKRDSIQQLLKPVEKQRMKNRKTFQLLVERWKKRLRHSNWRWLECERRKEANELLTRIKCRQKQSSVPQTDQAGWLRHT